MNTLLADNFTYAVHILKILQFVVKILTNDNLSFIIVVMKHQTRQCKDCKLFKILYIKNGLRFKKMHLGVCKFHNHIGDKNNSCPYWRGKKDC